MKIVLLELLTDELKTLAEEDFKVVDDKSYYETNTISTSIGEPTLWGVIIVPVLDTFLCIVILY